MTLVHQIFRHEDGALAAPILDLPAERSDAASATTSNEGWPASAARNCCPATPVAPMTATVFFIANLHETQQIGQWARKS
mgnify:CR=1 FL=1